MRPPLTVTEQPVVLPPCPDPVRPGGAGTPVAIWDVDRTLIRGDTLLPFLHRFTSAARLGSIVVESLARHRERSSAKAAVLQQVLGGLNLGAVDHTARNYVLTELMRRFRPGCLHRWQWHRAQGHRTVLASASLGVYLDHLGSALGADDVLCTRMAVVNGRLTGRLSGPDCRGERKAEQVRAYLAAHDVGTVYVYADGAADEPIRTMADVAVRIRQYRLLPAVTGSRR